MPVFCRKKEVFSDVVKVFFRLITDEEISYYIRNYKPFDKVGDYGIQEWMIMISISKIKDSYFTAI